MVIILLPLRLGFDMVRVIQNDAAFLDRIDVVLVRMLIKGEQDIRVIARAEHFARPDADLENRWSTGNGGRNGHEGHDLLFTPPSQARQKAADGLNSVLRIAGDADDGFRYSLDRSAAR